MKKPRKPPRWTVAFLRALERCGEARASAEAAGVDHTTAYARRRAHADFAEAWAAALAAYEERKRRGEEEEDPSPSHCSAAGPSLSLDGRGASSGEELTISNGQLKRVGPGRWSKKKERIFLAELHASGNIARGARAIGMSEQAISARRQKEPRLDQACEIAIAAAAARLHAMVVAAGNQAFDPSELPNPDESPLPPVSVREAIDIIKLRLPAGASGPSGAEPYDMAEMTARIAKKMEVLGWLNEEAKKKAGWTRDERNDCWVPPGWIQGPGDHAEGAED